MPGEHSDINAEVNMSSRVPDLEGELEEVDGGDALKAVVENPESNEYQISGSVSVWGAGRIIGHQEVEALKPGQSRTLKFSHPKSGIYILYACNQKLDEIKES